MLVVLRRISTVLVRMLVAWCSPFSRKLGCTTCKAAPGEEDPREGGLLFISPLLFFVVLTHNEQVSHLTFMLSRALGRCQGYRTDLLSPSQFSLFVGRFLHMQVFRLKLQSKNGEET